MTESFVTWEVLATFTGAATLTGLLTQWLKEAFYTLPTQWLSYIVALFILFGVTAVTQWDAPCSVWALIPVNAVIVSLSANGAFSAVKRIVDESTKSK